MTPEQQEPADVAGQPGGQRHDLTRMVNHGPVGFVITNKTGTIEWVNETLLRWLGYEAVQLVGQKTFQELLSPGGRIYYDTHVRPLMHMRHVANEIALELVCTDQRRLPVLINASLHIDEATGVETIETFVADATRRRQYETELLHERQSAEQSEARLQLMYDIASGLTDAQTVDQVVDVVRDRASRSMNGATCSIWLLEAGDHAAARIDATDADVLVEVEFPDGGPALTQLNAGQIVVIGDRNDEATGSYPLIRLWMAEGGLRSAAIAPLITDGRLHGMMSYGYQDVHAFDEAELRTARALAAQTEQALVRARILEGERRSKRLAENLLEFTTMLSAALTLGDVIDIIVERGQQLLGAVGTRLALLDDSGTSVRFVRNGDEEGQAMTLPLDKRSIGCEAIRTNGVVVVNSDEELSQRYPESPILDHPNFGRVMATPLRRGTEVLGAWILAEGDAGPSDTIDATMFELFAEQAGQATQRAAIHEAETLARTQADVRNVVSMALNHAMTTAEVGLAITDQGRDAFDATTIAILVVDPDDPTSLALRTGSGVDDVVAQSAASRLNDDHLTSLMNGLDTPIFTVGQSDFDELLDRTLGTSRRGAAAILPLTDRGYPLGLIVMGFDRPDALSSATQVALSGLVAEATVALARAQRYDIDHGVATTLQRTLLPRVDSVSEHWEVTTSHEPWSDLLEVGGDLFDVTPFADGRIVLVVGDVVGHGLAAAASMGLLRSAAKMLALITESPAEVIAGLNAFAAVTPGVLYSSVCCVEIRPDGNGRYSCAGHPFPVVRHCDGQTELLEGARSPLLGVSDAMPSNAPLMLPVGSTLVVYSDGLVERRGQTVDEGINQLRELLSTWTDSSADRDAERVVRAMFGDESHEDDVVVVCVTRIANDLRAAR